MVLDEIPSSYKDIDEVMANQADLVEVVHTLKAVMCVKEVERHRGPRFGSSITASKYLRPFLPSLLLPSSSFRRKSLNPPEVSYSLISRAYPLTVAVVAGYISPSTSVLSETLRANAEDHIAA
ncbi:tRNA-splicing ligase RtcB [Nitrosospira sp. Nsp11]|nr:tRNA-splicing ligase RtcB [Nitrosospira sp. Nsp11]